MKARNFTFVLRLRERGRGRIARINAVALRGCRKILDTGLSAGIILTYNVQYGMLRS
jgi:hypothetical protein